MIDFLQSIDTNIFLFFNGLNSQWADFLFYWVSNRFIWIPLYAVFLFFLIKIWKKESIYIALIIILSIILTDQTCNIIKKTVQRPRPSHNTELCERIHLVKQDDGTYYKGGQYGFPSSHAANAMAFAWFFIFYLCRHKKWLIYCILAWVLLLSYSRIYLGVHYPGDIVTGWLIGSSYAFLSVYCIQAIHLKKAKKSSAQEKKKLQ